MQHEPGTRDVVEQLMDDHRRVDQLLEQLEGAEPDEMEAVLDEIEGELAVHMEIEELYVYPVMEELDETEGYAAEGESEHEQVRELLSRFRELGTDDPGADGMVAAIKAAIEHHVEEEETESLPALREHLDPDRLAELSRTVEQHRLQAVTGEGEADVSASMSEEETIELAADEAEADLDDATKEELYEEARARDLPGRSQMSVEELRDALRE